MRLSYNVKRNLGQFNEYENKEDDVELKGDVELDFNDEQSRPPVIEEIKEPQFSSYDIGPT